MRLGIGLGLFKAGLISAGVRIFSAFQTRVIGDGGTVESGTCVVNGINSSALLQQASFLLIPSGYKANKLYSEIPTNGNGDLTWTRTSTASRTNSSGNIELMATGVPRLSYMYGSCPSALLEPQRTNLLTYSEQFDNSAWSVNTATVTPNTEISPSGLMNADTITNISGSLIGQNPSLATIGQIYTFSIYIKRINGNGSINLVDVNGNLVPITITNEWKRYNVTATASSTSLRAYFRVMVTGDSIAAWGAQIEAGAYATTYIPTTSATATRVADSFSRNNIYTNGLISASGGTWFVEFKGNNPKIRDGFMTFGLTDVASNNGFYFNQPSGVSQRLTLNYYLGGSATTNVFVTTTDNVKLAIKWNGSTADIFENGVKVVSNISFTFTQMQILNCSGVGITTFIQQMALFPTPLSDTDCTTITTL